jgi:hypothetical protein
LRLAISLRNRASHPVAMPSIDLSVTDSAGQLIARRVLRPPDFAQAPATLMAGAEVALQALLSAGPARVSGYTVEIFYP